MNKLGYRAALLTLVVMAIALLAGILSQWKVDWRTIGSSDHRAYVTNLRAIGCPENYIRDIIRAEITHLYIAREQPLKPARFTYDNRPAARGTNEWSSERERMEQLRAVQSEKRALVQQLLGLDLPREVLRSTGYRNYEAAELAFSRLPPNKRDAVQSIQENYWQASDALQERFPRRGAAFVEEYRRLNAEKEAAFAKILTREEIEDYEMRTQPTGTELARRTADMALSDTEFKSIWKLRKEYEEATGRVKGIPDAEAVGGEKRRAARELLTNKLHQVLGPDRYREYEMSTDDAWQQMKNLAARYGIPLQKLAAAYEMQKQSTALPRDRAELNEQMRNLLGNRACIAWETDRDTRVSLSP